MSNILKIYQRDTYLIAEFSVSIADGINITCTYSFVDSYGQQQSVTVLTSPINGNNRKDFRIDASISFPFVNGRSYNLILQSGTESWPNNNILFLGKPSSPNPYYQTSFLNQIHFVLTNPIGDSIKEYEVKLYNNDNTCVYSENVIPIIYESEHPTDESELDGKSCLFFEYYDASVNNFYRADIVAKNSFSESSITSLNLYTVNYSHPPTISSIDYSDKKVRVSFTWPTYTGGNNVEIYAISAKVTSQYSGYQLSDNRIIDINHTTKEIDFSGLNYGWAYDISLYAENEAGDSSYATVTVYPKIMPSPPVIKNVDPRNRMIIITYNVTPNSDYCFIQYQLTNMTTGKIEISLTEFLAVQGEDATFTIECVKNAQQYMITYRTANAVGKSEYNYVSTTTYEDLTVYNKLKLVNTLNQPCALSQKQMYANRIRNPGRMIKRSYVGFM